ncbi:hypothetical protein I3843_03G141700 [Carya illinoinensis]|uniref:Uncharacterized protein n=1 Tax=Carya illinoinensis TaxID=32201 RepID=A0A8T1R0W5_CARIL|nr:uncharacterized protein LOC122305540 [Carya illinoinensis]KAG2716700.1 hypothetical protein I3760_03G140000 [Carya illinoinensis]KAG6661018.1 hypothetical protein CIPAW_03G145800 [Carya illinoinensis]KAG6721993.1 hypothetical protein I3842_03G139800 [Carya illinoinensis]KAG7987586.1 hypothetical protein I3843_03G141700 [Carya illinoinensis]
MGRSESQQECKKHQNEKQLPGVCSSCLREKLSQLNASASNMKTTGGFGYFGSSSPNSPSASSSIFVSPIYGRHHRRALEKTGGSISFTLKVGHDYGLKKSRSVAFISRSLHEEAASSGKKKGGFWSKLLWSAGKRTKDVLKHSRAESRRLE